MNIEKFLKVPIGSGSQLIQLSDVALISQASTTSVTISYKDSTIATIIHATAPALDESQKLAFESIVIKLANQDWKRPVYEPFEGEIPFAVSSVIVSSSGGGGGGTFQNASQVSTNTSNFDNILSTSDTNVQLALNTIDNIVVKPIVENLFVDKGGGNTDLAAIEIGDRVMGWLTDTRFIAGVVTALPHTTEGNINFAVDSEIV